MTHDEIVEALKAKKMKLGWTYEDLSDKSGYAVTTMFMLFNGRNVGLLVLLTVIEILGMEISVASEISAK